MACKTFQSANYQDPGGRYNGGCAKRIRGEDEGKKAREREFGAYMRRGVQNNLTEKVKILSGTVHKEKEAAPSGGERRIEDMESHREKVLSSLMRGGERSGNTQIMGGGEVLSES